MSNTDNIYNNTQSNEKKPKRKIVLSEKKRNFFADTRKEIMQQLKINPALKQQGGLHKKMLKADQELVAKYAEITLKSINYWIRINGFKKMNVYQEVKEKININEKSFYNILNGEKGYSLETRIDLIRVITEKREFEPFHRDYMNSFGDAVKEFQKIWNKLDMEIETLSKACVIGKKVSKKEQEEYFKKAKKIEKEKEKRKKLAKKIRTACQPDEDYENCKICSLNESCCQICEFRFRPKIPAKFAGQK